MKHEEPIKSLHDFETIYEETEIHPVKAAPKTVKKPKVEKKPSRASIRPLVSKVRGQFSSIVSKLKLHRKKSKNKTKEDKSAERKSKLRGIIGIGLLFVVVSIAYSTYQTNLFVDGWEMVVALAPQVIFAAIISIYAFYKIYK